jgi:hypothetical protein
MKMTTPEPLPGETDKAYSAFKVFCESDNPSVTKVAAQLSKSRQLITRWASKYDWRRRFAAQRLREAQQKIEAEERATEKVAVVTEQERARAARKTFEVAERFVGHAEKIMEQHPVAAARLFAVGKDVTEGVSGVARGYHVGVGVSIAMQRKYPTLAFDSDGQRVEPSLIQSYEEALAILHAAEKSKPPLPCDNWSPDHADATPTPAPEEIEQENQDVILVDEGLPSRVDTMPTSDGRRADAPPLRR